MCCFLLSILHLVYPLHLRFLLYICHFSNGSIGCDIVFKKGQICLTDKERNQKREQ